MRRERVGVLYSGGLDSAALVAYFLSRDAEVWPVYVQSSLPWERTELAFGRRFLDAVARRNLHPLSVATLNLENAYEKNWSRTGKTPGADSSDEAVFLPARNLLLVTKAMLSLFPRQVFELAIATLKGNPFPDATPRYFGMLESVMSAGFRHKIRVRTPFLNRSKSSVIRTLRDFPLHESFSCIAPKDGLHCGVCNKCAERKRAFREAGLNDRTAYAGRDLERKRAAR